MSPTMLRKRQGNSYFPNRKRGLLAFAMPKFDNMPYSLTAARRKVENWPQEEVRRMVLQRE